MDIKIQIESKQTLRKYVQQVNKQGRLIVLILLIMMTAQKAIILGRGTLYQFSDIDVKEEGYSLKTARYRKKV